MNARKPKAQNQIKWQAGGKQLKSELNKVWRYHSGEYRILCQLQDDVFIELKLEAGHRKKYI